jgi:hypothetical protein
MEPSATSRGSSGVTMGVAFPSPLSATGIMIALMGQTKTIAQVILS